ncbi:MAG: crotonase/enoyl-CoA hydratase family protein [bacterium]
MSVSVEKEQGITIVTINRPEARNAVDRPTAEALADAFRSFDNDPDSTAAVLHGAGGNFCAGADLKALSDPERQNRAEPDGDGPMGPSRLELKKPVIAAVSGYAVAGGLELALWCDLRVVDETAVFGVFCRRWGVPLIDGGTVRLPRLIGLSRAMDMILTGRAVEAQEALDIGLANRRAEKGEVKEEAVKLARSLAGFPQTCLQNDRLSALQSMGMSVEDALQNEFRLGLSSLQSTEMTDAVGGFVAGRGRHGDFEE